MSNSFRRFAPAVLALALSAAVLLAADAVPATTATTASAPSTEPVMVPAEVFAKMQAAVHPIDSNTPEEEGKASLAKDLKVLIPIAEQAEKDYAGAGNLYVVQFQILRAADWLRGYTKDKAYEAQAQAAFQRIMAGDAPKEIKFQADMLLLGSVVMEAKATEEELAKQIRSFVSRHVDPAMKPFAAMFGTLMAMEAGLDELTKELLEKVRTDYAENPKVQEFLKHVNFGKAFSAEVTKLDGTKLSLPKDLAGKIIVIDFWASWCPPCRKDMPEMKELYAKYKDKGVEFVGISLDRQKEDAQKYVTENKIDWIQTFDGDQNPVAVKYNVANIPAVWVIGKDGTVLSDTARGRLARVLDRALGTPASMPATAPAASKTE